MSYAPIYNKLRELDERVALMENTPKTTDEGITIVPIASNGLTTDELNKVKTDFENLLKESSALSTRIGKLTSLDLALSSLDLATLATKDELATLATKDELATLATKDELATLATKDDLATLATKDELATLATKDELATLATKDELATLATKDEVANLLVKFDNVINVISQLNAKINDAHEKLADL